MTGLPSNSVRPNVRNLTSSSQLIRYRCMIAYRCLLALLGGYVFASLTAITIGQIFAEYRSSAASAATLIGFVVHVAVFIWVFMVQKTRIASLGVLLPCIGLFLLNHYLGSVYAS